MFSNNNGTPEAFINNMDNWSKITWGKVNNIIKGISTVLFQQVIEDTPVDNGWTMNSWFFSIDKPSTRKLSEYGTGIKKKVKKVYDKSPQGNVLKIQKQIKRASPMTKKGVAQHTYYLTNNAWTAIHLEKGTMPYGFSKKAPLGMVHKNVQQLGKATVSKYATYKTGDEG